MANSQLINNPVTWDSLREEGLKHLQAISGHIWTDLRVHDPGVTILETLCYGITDLNSRLSLNIADLLAERPDQATVQQFFSPREILTIHPVTINDYRKLLIDLPGVKNAWLAPAIDTDPALYYDKDNNALLYDYASGAERITLNGLYRVYIEKDPEYLENSPVTQQLEPLTDTELQRRVTEKLQAHRNLCEEFVEINIMQPDIISVYSDIQIDENADANEVMAQVYFDLKNFISPRVNQYSLKRMFHKGKSVEEIFNGPQLEHGFIDDDELGTGVKRRELHTSDLIRIIMAHPRVQDVRNLFITNAPFPDMNDKKEWALALDDTKALLMEPFNSMKLRMFKNEIISLVSPNEVNARVAVLTEQSRREIFDDPALDLQESYGQDPNITAYEPLTHKLPSIYGVSETGLPISASAKRRAQAKQLRAYLLFFEQILVNYLKQLDSFKRIFALRQDRTGILQTYFSQLVPETLWQGVFPEVHESQVFQYREDDPNEKLLGNENAFKRQNRILDHLLAQFNERFADYALFGFKYNMMLNLEPRDKNRYYLLAKADFLEKYPELSRNRNQAYNFSTHPAGPDFHYTDGLKNLIAAKLGLDIYLHDPDKNEWKNFFIVEHILFRPDGAQPLDFICSEKIAEEYQPDPYSYQLTYVIPKKAGRFANNKFKELFYTTIANETPAHISYKVQELDPDSMQDFRERYQQFFLELKNRKQGGADQLNLYRNQMMDLLGIGRARLPVLHLDANQIKNTAGTQAGNGDPVTKWTDLSGNHHHAEPVTPGQAPAYHQDGLPFVRFDSNTPLKITKPLIQDDFSIVLVYKAAPKPGAETTEFNLVTGGPQTVDFALKLHGSGNLSARIKTETIGLESTSGLPHLAVFTRDKSAGIMRLYLDGALVGSRDLSAAKANVSLTQASILIGPDGNTAVCELGEVIIMDSALSGSRKQKLEAYLSAKWNIPLSAVSSIGKPVLHLDASDSRSVIRDQKTTKVSRWKDLSPAGRIAAQDLISAQPEYSVTGLGGLPALKFNNQGLKISNSGGSRLFPEKFTIAIVYQASNTLLQGESRLFDGTVSGSVPGQKGFSISIGRQGSLLAQGGAETIRLDAGYNEPHLAILSGEIIAGSILHMALSLDGKAFAGGDFQEAEAVLHCAADLYIGQSCAGADNFTGKIGEIVVYPEALSLWDRQRLENYLAQKWGLDISGVDPVATPVLHLDASRMATVSLDQDTKVTQWVDLSHYGHDAIQKNSYRRPQYSAAGIHGLGAIQFTQTEIGADIYEDSLAIEQMIQNDFTIMAVIALGQDSALPPHIEEGGGWTKGAAFIDADCSGRYNDFGLSLGEQSGKILVMAGIGDQLTGDHTIQTRGLDPAQPHFITFTRQKATGEVKLYADGLLHAQADLRDDVALNDSRNIQIGASNSEGTPFRGLIGEIVIFDTALSDQKQQRIEKYLAAKWKIPATALPIPATGLILHLDAANSRSITKEPDQKVSEWVFEDTGDEVKAVQDNPASRPLYVDNSINGLPALRFNNSWMTVTPPAPMDYHNLTIAVVFNPLSTGATSFGWGSGAGLINNYVEGAAAHSFGVAMKDNGLRAWISADSITTPATVKNPQIAVVTRNQGTGDGAGALKIYLNGLVARVGAFSDQTGLNDSPALTIGAIQIPAGQTTSKGYFHGDIAELIIFNRLLDTAERQMLEKHLALKWRIDITGISQIAKPVLHLDASLIDTVILSETPGHRISQWRDAYGHGNDAVQTNQSQQPIYTCNPDQYQGLGVIHFDGAENHCLTLKPLVSNDFTVIIVYKADSTMSAAEYLNEFKPVAPDSFTGIANLSSTVSQKIWDFLTTHDYIGAADGMVRPKFNPGSADFTLGLSAGVSAPVLGQLEAHLGSILLDSVEKGRPLQENSFTKIPGLDGALSRTIWSLLQVAPHDFINGQGMVLKYFTQNTAGFMISLIQTALIHRINQILDARVSKSIFTGISGVDQNLATDIWDSLIAHDYLDANGNLRPAFTPEVKDFTLALGDELRDQLWALIRSKLLTILSGYQESHRPVPDEAFSGLVTNGQTLSLNIKTRLIDLHYLDPAGNINSAKDVADLPALFFSALVNSLLIQLILDVNRITGDSFTPIYGINNALSKAIRAHLLQQNIIDKDGRVLTGYTPGAPDFSLHLTEVNLSLAQAKLENRISFILSSYVETDTPVPDNVFDEIPGWDHQLSETLRDLLVAHHFLDPVTKKVVAYFTQNTETFMSTVVEGAIINVILAKNWVTGAGLFDGNCAGVRADLYRRDFGILVDRPGKLVAAIGVSGAQDSRVEAEAPFNALHIGILTRKKETGIVKLYVDQAAPVPTRVAWGVTLEDSDQFTIGAVNTGGNYFTGDIGEIIVLDKALDNEQIAAVQRYLAKKWGIDAFGAITGDGNL